MSVECGECEMDLRAGHAPGCSRYKPEEQVSAYLINNELIHPIDAPEVERLVLRVLAAERSRLREKVEAMERRTVPENKADGWEMACAEVLALLAEPGEERT